MTKYTPSPGMRAALQQKLDRLYPLKEPAFERFLAICQFRDFAKHEYLLREGQVARGIFFIESGSVRLMSLREEREHHHFFFLANDFAKEMTSLTTGRPTQLNLVAMEETRTAFFPRERLIELYAEDPSFELLGKRIVEEMVVTHQQLHVLLTTLKPEERYAHVLAHRPELLQVVPLQYLSSYLGMARETLSRVRNRS